MTQLATLPLLICVVVQRGGRVGVTHGAFDAASAGAADGPTTEAVVMVPVTIVSTMPSPRSR